MEDIFLSRIKFRGDIKTLFYSVCDDYNLGEMIDFYILKIGYEDFNAKITTEKGSFLVKIFLKTRTHSEIQGYLEIIQKAILADINYPKMIKSVNGKFLGKFNDDLYIVTEFIDSPDLFHGDVRLNDDNIDFILSQICQIQSINIKTQEYYDPWSIVNVVAEYKKHRDIFMEKDSIMIEPIINRFEKEIDFSLLPITFVHGDLTLTNLIKKNEEVYILDFSVANNAPRIQELAVFIRNTVFAQRRSNRLNDIIDFVVNKYKNYGEITDYELKLVPLYTRACLVTNIIGANIAIKEGNSSEETLFWLQLGRDGLNET